MSAVPSEGFPAMTDPEALIVAGGQSRRFEGGDKALAPLNDVPLVRRVAAALDSVTDGLVVNCRRVQQPALTEALAGFDHRFATDPIPDRGPVAGLLTGLRAVATPRAVVAACDQPLLVPADIRTLREAADGGGAAFALDGVVQPFPAVLPVKAARDACTSTIACGADRLSEVVARLDPVSVVPSAPKRLSDADSRSDLEAVRDALPASGDGPDGIGEARSVPQTR